MAAAPSIATSPASHALRSAPCRAIRPPTDVLRPVGGHDRMLAQLAGIRRAASRDCDVLARIGGEEFAQILHRISPEQARARLARLRERLHRDPIGLDGDTRLRVIDSIGDTVCRRVSGADPVRTTARPSGDRQARRRRPRLGQGQRAQRPYRLERTRPPLPQTSTGAATLRHTPPTVRLPTDRPGSARALRATRRAVLCHQQPMSLQDHDERVRFHVSDALGGLEWLSARYVHQRFSRHAHAGYSIALIERGTQGFFNAGANHLAPTDSLILVNADTIHTGQAASSGGWAYRALYPTPEQFEQVWRVLGQPGRRAPWFRSPVVHDPALAHRLRTLFTLLDRPASRLARDTALHDTLARLMRDHAGMHAAPGEPGANPRLALVRDRLEQAAEEEIPLAALARLAGCSPAHLVRAFHRRYGLPPHAYQVQARLRRAAALLRQGATIGAAACAAGFHDQSHLHRHFKRARGITPGQYLAQYRARTYKTPRPRER
ncbi:helix-turn-helix domain-containing protein [Marichromatium sp. AB32]|nr:helix-turn-helix domain-containing protein [Marichromatium sp. AB32]